MLDEGQHVMISSNALEVMILLNDTPEGPISRNFLSVMVEAEHVEL